MLKSSRPGSMWRGWFLPAIFVLLIGGLSGSKLPPLDDVYLDGGHPAVRSGGLLSTLAVSALRMSATSDGIAKDHFNDDATQSAISFSYDNLSAGDEVRLIVRDVDGTPWMDHTYRSLVGTGTQRLILTGSDAFDGLVYATLEAGSTVASHADQAMRADSRFELAPHIERAIVAATVMENAAQRLRDFQVGAEADTDLVAASDYIDAALVAGRAAFQPGNDLPTMKHHVATMRDEVRRATVKIAEVRSILRPRSFTFPETFDCQFNLTNLYLNEAPVDSIQWTVGTPSAPAHIHPPEDSRRAGLVRAQPLTIYTQQVGLPNAPHQTEVTGRVVDTHCRPVVDGTPVTLSLDEPALGSLTPTTVETSGGYFSATLHATDELGDGAVVVQGRAGDVQGARTVFLVGIPATVQVSAGASTVKPSGHTRVTVQVVDALGQAVADGTTVELNVSPPEAGSISPSTLTTTDGFATATFTASSISGRATIRASANDAEGSAVIAIADMPATPTPSPH